MYARNNAFEELWKCINLPKSYYWALLPTNFSNFLDLSLEKTSKYSCITKKTHDDECKKFVNFV